MLKYIIRRILQAIPITVMITLVAFFLVYMAPGSPFDAAENPRVPREVMLRLQEMYGLNDPIHVQYWNWIKNILQGNLGISYSNQMVSDIISARLYPTILLMSTFLIVSLAVAIPIGIIAAVRQYSVLDYLLSIFSYVGISTPSFWLGIMLMFAFAVKIRLFPTHGMKTYGVDNPFDTIWHMVLPVTSLAFLSIAGWSRYVRAQMLEVIRQDYVRTARAKGLSERVVIYKHAVRNAMIPVVTLIGLSVPSLVSGAAITESIFSWPGLGRQSVQAALNRDYPTVMAFVLITGIAVQLGNLLADVMYAAVDPRIRYD